MCDYIYKNGLKCTEDPYKDSKFCILHIDFPENHKCEEYYTLANEKEQLFLKKVAKNDLIFEGIKIERIEITNLGNIDNPIVFHLWNSKIMSSICFSGEIYGDINICGTDIAMACDFNHSIITGNLIIEKSKIGTALCLSKAMINGNVSLVKTKINQFIHIIGSTITCLNILGLKVLGDACFSNSNFTEEILFLSKNDIDGKVTFNKTKFGNVKDQEKCCRLAKTSLEDLGDKEGADYYYFREMEAKRVQKNKGTRFFEYWFIQLPFGYGTTWLRTIITWLVVVFGLPFYYCYNHHVEKVATYWDGLYFSIVTATTLGYGDCLPVDGFPKAVASFEAIFGTFMWAAFITIFARKYMR